MPRLLAALLAAALVGPAARAAEPEFNGRALSAWVTQLREDTVPRKRRAAAVAVGQIGASGKDALPVALQSLGRALRVDASPAVREQAASALGQLRIEDTVAAVPDLTESLRVEKEVGVRRQVATALGRFGRLAKPAVGPLTQALKDPDPGLRAVAADALGRVGADARGAAPDLLPLLADPERPVRLAAVFALGRVEPEDTGPAADGLAKSLKGSADGELRREAVVSLGFLGDRRPETVAAVAAVLADPDAELRQQAALALARFGSAAKGAEPQLRQAVTGDADKTVRTHALRALTTAYGPDAADLVPFLVERLKADADFEVRVAVAEELGGLGAAGKPALAALRDARRDPQIKVRDAAAGAVKRIEAPPPSPKP